MQGIKTTHGITGDAVKTILMRVYDQATADGKRIFVAVVDHTGQLVGLLAHDGAPGICRQIAQDKAYTAFSVRRRTSAWKAYVYNAPIEERDLMLSQPRFIAASGGCPILVDGEVAGAVGVSGAGQDEDEALAELGASVPLQT
jgi:glc operon protein GlcG